ncbi:uridine kinase family protein [Prochlorococcus marinus]|uniref:uridine kinase family protein n=1 Tax=Prochlorococcus marinus TaxID=1219 RepID=UPI0022B47C44|nr:AAA family ATPase [Prochlorococcus marinus]
MKTIVITGPSGSGKSYLSNKLSKLFYNSIVIKTDSYYRNNILIKFFSKFLYDIYDRPMSIKKSAIKNNLRSIHKKERLIPFYKYDFKSKDSSVSEIRINYTGENQFLILEGIFAHRLDLNYQESINIVCEDKKSICFKRRIKRDQLERGRSMIEINNKFDKSWYLFYKNINHFRNNNKVFSLNGIDKMSYDKLLFNLKNLKK